MSFATIDQAANDPKLQDRVKACVSKEAWVNPNFDKTVFGEEVRLDPTGAMLQMMWPVAIDTEAAYESGVIAGNPEPGGDPAVITDAMILSAVQAHWPDKS